MHDMMIPYLGLNHSATFFLLFYHFLSPILAQTPIFYQGVVGIAGDLLKKLVKPNFCACGAPL